MAAVACIAGAAVVGRAEALPSSAMLRASASASASSSAPGSSQHEQAAVVTAAGARRGRALAVARSSVEAPFLRAGRRAPLGPARAAATEAPSGSASTSAAEVEEILKTRIQDDGTVQYLIKWRDGHEDTWEPAENLAPGLVTDFLDLWWVAAKKADTAELRRLAEQGRLIDITDSDQRTALHFVSGRGAVDAVRLLLDAGADVTLADKDGYTALHFAAGYTQTDAVRELLEAGADPDQEDNAGRSPLKLARELLDKVKDDPIQFGRRVTLAEIVRLLDEAVFEEVEVRAILDKREADGGAVEYLVSWSDDSEDSWEPADSISDELVADFEAGYEYAEVDEILDRREVDGRVEFLVRWKDDAEDSWEAKEDLEESAVAAFEAKRGAVGSAASVTSQ